MTDQGSLWFGSEGFSRICSYASQEVHELNRLVSAYHRGQTSRFELNAAFDHCVCSGGISDIIVGLVKDIFDGDLQIEELPQTLGSTTIGIIHNPSVVVRLLAVVPGQFEDEITTCPGRLRCFFAVDERVTDVYRYTQKDLTQLNKPVKLSIARDEPFEFDATEVRSIASKCPGYLIEMVTDFVQSVYIYDPKSRTLVAERPTYPATTRWLFIADILSRLKTDRALDLLKQMTGHPEPLVRWETAKVIFRHHKAYGLRVLEKFTLDTNDTIRQRARRELQRISALLEKQNG